MNDVILKDGDAYYVAHKIAESSNVQESILALIRIHDAEIIKINRQIRDLEIEVDDLENQLYD